MGLIDNVNVNVGGNGNVIDTLSTYVTKVLKPNIINGKNILSQDMMPVDTGANTKYVIKYDYTLAEDITVPENCILEFDGGSLKNGTVIFNDTYIVANKKIFDNVSFSGNILNHDIYIEWFGIKENNVEESNKLRWFFSQQGNLILYGGSYILGIKEIQFNIASNTKIEGNGSVIEVTCDTNNNPQTVFALRGVSNIEIRNIKLTSTKDAERTIPGGTGATSFVQAIYSDGICKDVYVHDCMWENMKAGMHSSSTGSYDTQVEIDANNRAINFTFERITSKNTELSFSGSQFESLVIKDSIIDVTDGGEERALYLLPLDGCKVLVDNLKCNSSVDFAVFQIYSNSASEYRQNGGNVTIRNSFINGNDVAPLFYVSNNVTLEFINVVAKNIKGPSKAISKVKAYNSEFYGSFSLFGNVEVDGCVFDVTENNSFYTFDYYSSQNTTNNVSAKNSYIKSGSLLKYNTTTDLNLANNTIVFDGCHIVNYYNNETIFEASVNNIITDANIILIGCRFNVKLPVRARNSAIVLNYLNCDISGEFNYSSPYVGDNAIVYVVNCTKDHLPLDGIISNRSLVKTQNPSSGNTRPSNVPVGYCLFDTNKPIWYKGSGVWVDATGNPV